MAQTKLDVGLIGQRRQQGPPLRVIRSLGHLVAIVEMKTLDPELHKEVMKVITGYPDGSLDYAYNNLDHTIFKCQEAISLRNPAPVAEEVPVVAPEDVVKVELPVLPRRKSLFDDDEDINTFDPEKNNGI